MGKVLSQDHAATHNEGRAEPAKRNAVGPWFFGVGGVALVTALATLVAVRDDSQGERSLEALNPVMRVADEVGWWLLQDPLRWITRWGVAVAVLAIIVGTILWWRRRDGVAGDLPPVTLALGLALLAQIFFLDDWHTLGVIFYAEAVMVIVVAHVMGRRRGIDDAGDRETGPPTYGEASILLAIGSVAVFFRYYGLNRMLAVFEGELGPFMAGATNLQGIWLANIGWEGPWAPMGILYYLPIWAMVVVGGSTVFAVRLGSAVIGVLTIIVVYLVVREVIGRTAALWSAALLAVDTLQVSWGRSDMHPHASTAWPGILLYGATIRALATGATGWYVAVMLLMGLSWHQYPSGQFVVIVPIIAFAVHAAQNPGFLRASWRKGILIVAGATTWVLGYPMVSFLAVGKFYSPVEYVSMLGPRLLGGSDDVFYEGIPIRELILAVSRNAWDLVLGLFIEAPHIFHQTVIPDVEGMLPKALPWFVVACAVVGLTICFLRFRESWSPPLLALVAAGILPAILSDEAWLKRASLLYVVLIILAAVPLAIVIDGFPRKFGRKSRWAAGGLLAIALLLWSSIWAHVWFSGRQFKYGVAAETTIVETLEKHIEPNTLLIASLWGDYIEGEIVYLLRDAVAERQPVALCIVNPLLYGWQTLLRNPRVALEMIETKPWYWVWLGLGDNIPAVVRHRKWSRVVYLIEHRPDVGLDFEVLADRCPDLQIERVFVGEEDEVINGEVWMRYHVWIARCDHHRGLRTPRFAVPAPDECW